MTRRLGLMALPIVGAAFAGFALAQTPGARPPTAPPATTDSGIVDFQTKVGSFKILSPSSEVKARGKITVSFQGTVLIVGLEGSATAGPGVKVQYDDPAHARKAYFGTGTLTIEGKWRAIQFFGRDLRGNWNGMGVMRLYGEFDDKLETGTYTIKGQAPEPWGNGGRSLQLPPMTMPGRVKPRIEDVKSVPKRPA